ncbi:hypothetical protein [Paenibacillus stellifer]|nr:hypothetical protein [Paenibacillus stellifer]
MGKKAREREAVLVLVLFVLLVVILLFYAKSSCNKESSCGEQ